jgi:hypothetical protein
MRPLRVPVLAAVVVLAACTGGGDNDGAPRVRPGEPCPVAAGREVIPGFRPAVGRAPIYATAFESEAASFDSDRRDGGWYSVKVLWLGEPGFDGRAHVTGLRLDGDGELRFGQGPDPGPELELDSERDVTSSLDSTGWLDWPSSVRFRQAGCYAAEVTGTGFRHEIVFRFVPE